MPGDLHSTLPSRIGAVVRKAIVSDAGVRVRTARLDPARALPFAVIAEAEGADLATWAADRRAQIDGWLAEHGGLLFRGFKVQNQADFERFLDAVALERMHYLEGATPRVELGHQVYTSTQFPAEQTIGLHNELSYAKTWPMKIAFCCLTPADSGGETPIADVRRVLARIPPNVRQTFAERQWRLVRNFGDGLSLPWQSVYRTDDRAEVERYCHASGIETEWKDETRLRTFQVRPALATHPRSGEAVWFNHVAFWHVSSLAPHTRQMLVSEYGEDGVPYNTYYGNGDPIDDAVIDELRRAYDAETIRFPWHRGDVLYLDNMLVAHGRAPYTGSRSVIVGMGEPFTRHDE